MSIQELSKSTAYQESLRGLHRLHALAVEGRQQSPEADDVRDDLDGPWYELSEAERVRIGGLSADLYSISDPVSAPLTMNPQVSQKLHEADRARERREWDRALELLRRWGKYLPPAVLSWKRGQIWQEMGDEETAGLFFQHAKVLDPSADPRFQDFAFRLFKSDEATSHATSILIMAAPETEHPIFVAKAVAVLLCSSRPESDVGELNEWIGALETARSRLKSFEPDVIKYKAYHGYICILLARCETTCGRLENADRYYTAGLECNPQDEGLRLLRGLLRYARDNSSVEDLQRLINEGRPRFVWPCFILAHYHLLRRESGQCRDMCLMALDVMRDDETEMKSPSAGLIQGTLFEWLAISLSRLGRPAEEVRAAFTEALALAPDESRIRENFELFERNYSHSIPTGENWTHPSQSESHRYLELGIQSIELSFLSPSAA